MTSNESGNLSEDVPDDEKQIRINRLNQQAAACLVGDFNQVDELCKKALEIAAPHGFQQPLYPQGTAESLEILGRFYMAKSNFSLALDYFRKSLRLFEVYGPVHSEALCRSYLGVLFEHLGDYSQSAEMLREALRSAETTGMPALEAEIMTKLSHTYLLTGDPNMALSYVGRGIQTFRETKDNMRLSWALETMGEAYLISGKHQEALACLQECVSLAISEKRAFDTVRFNQSIGNVYRALGKPERAQEIYQQVYDQARKLDIKEYECSALISIAEIIHLQKRYSESLPFLMEALEISRSIESKPQYRDCCRLLSTAYKHIEDYKLALEYHEQFLKTDKQLFNNLTDQRLKNLLVLFQVETAKKETLAIQLRAKALEEEVKERKHQQAFLEQLASTDSLTRTLNRRAFMEIAEKTFARAVDYNEPFALILIDADYFKQINDNYGHQVGDQTLALISNRLQNNIRAIDRLGRYGGEEFNIMMPGVDGATALLTAQRLCSLFSSQPIHLSELDLMVTLSFGVTAFRPDQQNISFEALVKQADEALYDAKHLGRNGVVLYSQKIEE